MSSAARRLLRASMEAAGNSVKLQETYDRPLVEDIFRHSVKRQTGVSLKYMLDFGQKPIEKQMILSAQFLHTELPIRLAHRVAELENLPFGLSSMKPVLKVRDWYVESFRDLKAMSPIKDASDEQRFTDMLQHIYQRHAHVVPTMASAIIKLKSRMQEQALSLAELPEIHSFLDGFYLSRIGIRMLIGQHISLHDTQKDGWIGAIHTQCDPREVAENAIEDARQICLREYGDAPEVRVYGASGLAFPYIPSHLHHIMFELVKNSLRAVADRFESAPADTDVPPIRVVISQGEEDITIKVSDEGGGIPRSGTSRIWTYMYSTGKVPLPDMEDVGEAQPSVLAGYGYGLPLSRLYARYFGGDLQVISMEGYGTDAYIHLNRLGDSVEPLP